MTEKSPKEFQWVSAPFKVFFKSVFWMGSAKLIAFRIEQSFNPQTRLFQNYDNFASNGCGFSRYPPFGKNRGIDP